MSIKIDGWASPEAPLNHNISLAERRAKSLRDYVSKKVSVNGKLITSEGHGENWPGFKKYVLAHEDLVWRDELLSIINDKSLGEDDKNQKILSRLASPNCLKTLATSSTTSNEGICSMT
jgi:hypothetical protein